MTRVGGTLDWRDMADPRRVEFARMTRGQQAEAVRRMAGEGHGEQSIAQASGLSVEAVRRVLGDQVAQR